MGCQESKIDPVPVSWRKLVVCPFEPGQRKPLGIQKFKLDSSGKTIQDKLSPDPIDGNKKSKKKTTKQKMLKPIV